MLSSNATLLVVSRSWFSLGSYGENSTDRASRQHRDSQELAVRHALQIKQLARGKCTLQVLQQQNLPSGIPQLVASFLPMLGYPDPDEKGEDEDVSVTFHTPPQLLQAPQPQMQPQHNPPPPPPKCSTWSKCCVIS